MQIIKNQRKVIFSKDDVAAFNAVWPASSLRSSRAYWFEFDENRDLVDTDVPEHDAGPAASAMADDAKGILFDNVTPDWLPVQAPPEAAETDNSANQARAQFNSIKALVDALSAAESSDDGTAPDPDYEGDSNRATAEQLRDRIQERPLSIEVRADWHTPGTPDKDSDMEYRILLCTGGPAVQIIGDLDQYGQPSSARLEHQDWFKPWTEWRDGPDNEEEILLSFASHFWFGE